MARTFMGFGVVLSEFIYSVPRMQCSREFCKIQSPELVMSTNRWMLEFFGQTRPVIKAGSCLYMHPDDWREIETSMARGDYALTGIETLNIFDD